MAAHRRSHPEKVARLIGPRLLAGLVFGATAMQAYGQARVIEDGVRRYSFGAGTSFYDGNNNTSSVSLSFDTVRATQREKLALLGKAQLSRNNGVTTGEVAQMAARYQREINPRVYGFGQAEALRDTTAKLSSRFSIANGSGYRLLRTERDKWDIFVGLGYARDAYTGPNEFGGQIRDRYSRYEMLLGQESSHQFTDNTTFKQRLAWFLNLSDQGQSRGEYDMALSVAMNRTLSLTTSISVRYNSQPGVGLEHRDVALITALSWKTN